MPDHFTTNALPLDVRIRIKRRLLGFWLKEFALALSFGGAFFVLLVLVLAVF